VDNRGRNPEQYFDNEKYPVIDNFLIENKIYPDLKKVKRYINQKTHDSFLRKYLEKDDVLITLVGNGFCSVSLSPSNKVVIIQNTIGLQTNEKLYNKFLYYYLILQQKNLVKLNRSSSQPSLNQQDLLDYEIEIPENIKDQQKIASVLSTLDAKIEINNKINTELEDMAKTLYDYWFVQFDFPDENGKPYKSSGGEMMWSDELKRDVPKGWEIDKINSKVKIGSGFPFDSDDYCNDGKYKIITIKNVQDGFLDTSTVDKINFIPEKINDFCVLKIGDILMSLTGNVGRMCFVDQENLLLNQRVGKLIGDKDFVYYMLIYFFKRPENQARLE
jgi:type I restriction enzyme S subunit